ncbi:MAG: hypothetical protein Q9199_002927 [Rusavskia elegans]
MASGEGEAYMLPRNTQESQRLDAQHEYMRQMSHGHLKHPSIPVQKLHAVADVATGTVHGQKPSFIGFDISDQQFPLPKGLPSHVAVNVHDMVKPFPTEYHEKFDLVNVRFVSYALKGAELDQVVRNVIQLLRFGLVSFARSLEGFLASTKDLTQLSRLLTLLPDWFEASIHVSLEITVLSDGEVPQFEALSYVWGDASDLLDIFLETSPSKRPELRGTDDIDSIEWRTLRITKNLFEALKHLRLEDRPRVLWIDAICVDQQNLEERGHQVLRMPNIYTSAKGVIVWLGPESDDTAIAMNAIQDLGSRITVDWELGTMAPASESDLDPDSKKSYDAVEPSPQIGQLAQVLKASGYSEPMQPQKRIYAPNPKVFWQQRESG